jgi:hypothetical protein
MTKYRMTSRTFISTPPLGGLSIESRSIAVFSTAQRNFLVAQYDQPVTDEDACAGVGSLELNKYSSSPVTGAVQPGLSGQGGVVVEVTWLTDESEIKERAAAERKPIFIDVRNPN